MRHKGKLLLQCVVNVLQSLLFVIMDHDELTFSEEKVAIVNEEVHILHSDISSIKLPLKSTYLPSTCTSLVEASYQPALLHWVPNILPSLYVCMYQGCRSWGCRGCHGTQQARSAKNVKKPQINVIVIDMSVWVMIEQNNNNL